MAASKTQRANIWEAYSNGSTQKQIADNTGFDPKTITRIVNQFISSEKVIKKYRASTVLLGDDDYTRYLLNDREQVHNFVLLTHNKSILTFAKKLGYIQ